MKEPHLAQHVAFRLGLLLVIVPAGDADEDFVSASPMAMGSAFQSTAPAVNAASFAAVRRHMRREEDPDPPGTKPSVSANMLGSVAGTSAATAPESPTVPGAPTLTSSSVAGADSAQTAASTMPITAAPAFAAQTAAAAPTIGGTATSGNGGQAIAGIASNTTGGGQLVATTMAPAPAVQMLAATMVPTIAVTASSGDGGQTATNATPATLSTRPVDISSARPAELSSMTTIAGKQGQNITMLPASGAQQATTVGAQTVPGAMVQTTGAPFGMSAGTTAALAAAAFGPSTTPPSFLVTMPSRPVYGTMYLTVAESMSRAFVQFAPKANGEAAIKSALSATAQVPPDAVQVVLKCNFGCKLDGEVSWLQLGERREIGWSAMSARVEAKFTIQVIPERGADAQAAVVSRIKAASDEKLGNDICTSYNQLASDAGGAANLVSDVSFKVESKMVTVQPAIAPGSVAAPGQPGAAGATPGVVQEDLVDVKFRIINLDISSLNEQQMDTIRQSVAAAYANASDVPEAKITVYIRKHAVGGVGVLLSDFVTFGEGLQSDAGHGSSSDLVKYSTTNLPPGTNVDFSADVDVAIVVPADRLPSAVLGAVSSSRGEVADSRIIEDLKKAASSLGSAVKPDVAIADVVPRVLQNMSTLLNGNTERPVASVEQIIIQANSTAMPQTAHSAGSQTAQLDHSPPVGNSTSNVSSNTSLPGQRSATARTTPTIITGVGSLGWIMARFVQQP